MHENIREALLVLLIGMFTVFIVLCLVVLSGKLLILVVNKYGPISKKSAIHQTDFIPLIPIPKASTSYLQKEHIAAIVSTVEIVTRGKGKITNIEKTNLNK